MIISLSVLAASFLLVVVVVLRQGRTIRSLAVDIQGLQLVTAEGGVRTEFPHPQHSDHVEFGLLAPGRPFPALRRDNLPDGWSLVLVVDGNTAELPLCMEFQQLRPLLADRFTLALAHDSSVEMIDALAIPLISGSVVGIDIPVIAMVDSDTIVQGMGHVHTIHDVHDFVREGEQAGIGPVELAESRTESASDEQDR